MGLNDGYVVVQTLRRGTEHLKMLRCFMGSNHDNRESKAKFVTNCDKETLDRLETKIELFKHDDYMILHSKKSQYKAIGHWDREKKTFTVYTAASRIASPESIELEDEVDAGDVLPLGTILGYIREIDFRGVDFSYKVNEKLSDIVLLSAGKMVFPKCNAEDLKEFSFGYVWDINEEAIDCSKVKSIPHILRRLNSDGVMDLSKVDLSSLKTLDWCAAYISDGSFVIDFGNNTLPCLDKEAAMFEISQIPVTIRCNVELYNKLKGRVKAKYGLDVNFDVLQSS